MMTHNTPTSAIKKHVATVAILLGLVAVGSQQAIAANDSLFEPRLRIGADLSGLVRYYFEPETRMWEIAADMEWRPHWFAALEAGGIDVNIQKVSNQYKANGYFFRTGVDYNLTSKPDMKQAGIVYGLVRYGFGRIFHEAPAIIIHNDNSGDYSTNIESAAATAHWFEFGGGLKTRLVGNVFLGWTLRTRFLIHLTETPGIEPYYITGFGKNQGKPSVMVHYFIYYRF